MRAGCGLHPGETFVSDVQDENGEARVRNYDGALGDVLACLGTLGADGGAIAAPLASMRAALDGTHAPPAAFHERNRFLFVGILAAQDDCSGPSPPADPLACATQGVRCGGVAPGAPGDYQDCVAASGPGVDSIDGYRTFLDGVVDDPNLLLLGVVAAPAAPFVVGDGPVLASSCPADSHAGALPAVRLQALAAASPGASIESPCASDWSVVLRHFTEQFARLEYTHCLDSPLMTDLFPGEPGLQIECSATDTRSPGTERETQRVIARCPMLDDATPDPAGVRPCWWVHPDSSCVPPASTGLAFEVERASGRLHPPIDTFVDVRCLSCGQP